MPKFKAQRQIQARRIGLEENWWEDVYHRLLRMPWLRFFRWTVLIYFSINIAFALLYSVFPGCIANIAAHDYFSYFAFSVQTFSTVGYGYFYPITIWAHMLVTLETATGLFTTALLTGLVFAKFARPGARIAFSESIVKTTYNGQSVLTLRLGNMRTNQVYEGQARMTLLRDEVSQEGEKLRRLTDLKLVRDSTPLFALSWTLYHAVDETSPFYGMSIDDIRAKNWDVFITFIGIDQDTNQTVVSHSTYSAEKHIVEAKKFADMIVQHPDGLRVIDFARLNDIEK